MNVSFSFVALKNFFVVHRAGIIRTFLLYSMHIKKQPVVDTNKSGTLELELYLITDYNEYITKTRVWGRTDRKPSPLPEPENNICNLL